MRALLIVVVALSSSGCISFLGAEPEEPLTGPYPAAKAVAGQFRYEHVVAVNGELLDGPSKVGGARDLPQDPSEVPGYVTNELLRSRLVGFVGQKGIEHRTLKLQVRTNAELNTPVTVLSLLTGCLVPLWLEMEYTVTGTIVEGDKEVRRAEESSSLHVLVQPLLLFAIPFDGDDDLGGRLTVLTHRVLRRLCTP